MKSVLALVLVSAVALCGCTTGTEVATTEPPASAGVEADAIVAITPGVVATGELESVDGVTMGSVVASYDGDSFVFDFPDFVTGDYSQLMFVLADDELGAADCFYDRYQTALAYPVGQQELAPLVIGADEYAGDPSFFSTLAVLEYPEGAPIADTCWFTTLAVSPLEWTVPDLHPDLVVQDSGEVNGAHGAVGLDESGAPLSYVTSSGDRWTAIAARFGVSADELLFLNPCRPIGYDSSAAYADEVLNLGKERRGERLRGAQ